MSAHEEDGDRVCRKCGATYDIHEIVSGNCDGDEEIEMDKPLHVQVAEALGWKRDEACSLMPPERCYGSGVMDGKRCCVSRYDTDWSATGPLIEKHKINLSKGNRGKWFATTIDPDGEPSCWHLGEECGFAPCGCESSTPLIAVCNLILMLTKEGKL